MVRKWIQGFIKHPITILKSIFYRYNNKNENLAKLRLFFCNDCASNVTTSLGNACEQCGCIIKNKVRIKDEKCELYKW